MTARRKKTVDEALTAAGRLFGTPKDLARAIGISQQHMSRLVLGKRPITAEIALRIQQATHGAVTADQLRPDLWQRPQHVPLARNGRA
jgi:DNA-binding transcriptional regulator YdaS (Cro superfamily)